MKRRFVFTAMSLLLCLSVAGQQTIKQQSGYDKRHDNPAPILSPSELPEIDLTRPAGLGKSLGPAVVTPLPAGADFRIADKSTFENAAQVIAPRLKPNCLNGKIVLSTGLPVSVYTRDLFDSEDNIARDVPPALSAPLTVPDGNLGTDNVLLKLNDNSLLMLRNGLSWEDTADKPKWWGKFKIQDQPHGSRVVTHVLRSTDCGATWQHVAAIDPLKFDKGQYAVPRPLLNFFGGWDRLEAYVDPWNGYIYVSMNAAAGVADAEGNVLKIKDNEGRDVDQQTGTHLLFRSTNRGKDWSKIHDFHA